MKVGRILTGIVLCGAGMAATSSLATASSIVAAGNDHSCAVVDGGVECWGDNSYGQLGNSKFGDVAYATPVATLEPGSGAQVTDVVAGSNHTCAIVDGGVQCWGDNFDGQLGTGNSVSYKVPTPVLGLSAGSGVTAIAASADHTCAVVNGGVQCWGYNSFGKLGTNDTVTYKVPTSVVGLGAGSGATAIAAGSYHTCAIVNGGAQCWGDNGSGQLGTNDSIDHHVPTPVVGMGVGSGVTAIATGAAHTCAIVNGGVQCWGYNGFGELGTNDTVTYKVPTPVAGLGASSGVTAIAAGARHSCAVIAQAALCWGDNEQGQLGDATTTNRLKPKQVFGFGFGSGVTAITTGSDHSCAMKGSQVYCWGLTGHGALGDGTDGRDRVPHPVSLVGAAQAQAVATGKNFSCVLTTSGGVQCWGDNSSGQLGNGQYETAFSPTASGITMGATQIAAGRFHACAIANNGGVQCWGYNSHGELGTGDTLDSSTPKQAGGFGAGSGVTAIAAGWYHSCAVIVQAAFCWGLNDYGQLGTNDDIDYQVPTPVVGLGAGSGVTAIAAGAYHTCAIVDGGVQCWGDNYFGQLGTNDNIDHQVPTPVVGLGAGSGVTAIAAGYGYTCAIVNGSVQCWGYNAQGQLGTNDTTYHQVPTPVVGPSGVTTIAAGAYHTCARTVGQAVSCWGYGNDGQLGNGWLDDREVPAGVTGLAFGSGATAINAGNAHTCAIVNGGVQCWGEVRNGALGIFQTGRITTPVLVQPNDVIFASQFQVLR
jgi:alpha-tubulin suppressor-like RCC1 family protein